MAVAAVVTTPSTSGLMIADWTMGAWMAAVAGPAITGGTRIATTTAPSGTMNAVTTKATTGWKTATGTGRKGRTMSGRTGAATTPGAPTSDGAIPATTATIRTTITAGRKTLS